MRRLGPMAAEAPQVTDHSTGWWRGLGVEAAANLAAILIVPPLAVWLWQRYEEAFQNFGVGSFMSMLAGIGSFSDIGWEVASAKALVEPGLSAYDPLTAIHGLIGMTLISEDPSSHSHPPTSLPLGLPLAPFDYSSWLPYWMVIAVLMLAWSMRLLKVPPHIAYPLAVAISLSVPGRWGIVSSYPLAALLISLAWWSRGRWLPAGLAYGLFGAMRGVGVLMLLYPVVKKQWKAVVTALATIAILLGIALAFEGDSVQRWLTVSRASIEANMTRDELLTLGSILARHEISTIWSYVIAVVVAVVALWRGSNLFWVLNWVILAISPIGWHHTTLQAIPLMVMMWRAGRFGQAAVLIIGASAMTQQVDSLRVSVFTVTWIVFVVASGLTLLFGRIPPTEELPLVRRLRARMSGRVAQA